MKCEIVGGMVRLMLMWLGVLLMGWGLGDPGWAARQPAPAATPVVLTVNLGTAEGELRFEPDQIQMRVGVPYQLHLVNPSPMKHYFTAKDFADAIWTRKVQTEGAEIKGHINNVELKPGASLDWYLVPQQPGSYGVVCTIPGHREAGMVAEVVIQG
ncbi:MAG: plastocyanin/azurin family copper-binding protein [Thermostichales cyanobacterium BF4_bins_65]